MSKRRRRPGVQHAHQPVSSPELQLWRRQPNLRIRAGRALLAIEQIAAANARLFEQACAWVAEQPADASPEQLAEALRAGAWRLARGSGAAAPKSGAPIVPAPAAGRLAPARAPQPAPGREEAA